MDINRAIDDSIDNLEPLEPNLPRSEVLYHKFFAKSKADLDRLRQVEEDLDHLLQVGGVFGSSTTSQRRTSQHPLKGSRPRRLLRLHQQCHTFTKQPSRPDGASILVGWARALEGHESLKLPSSAHLFAPPSWSGGPGHWKGTSPPSY
jgi:hypothetical protein